MFIFWISESLRCFFVLSVEVFVGAFETYVQNEHLPADLKFTDSRTLSNTFPNPLAAIQPSKVHSNLVFTHEFLRDRSERIAVGRKANGYLKLFVCNVRHPDTSMGICLSLRVHKKLNTDFK